MSANLKDIFPTGKWLGVSSGDVATGKQVGEPLKEQSGRVTFVAFSLDGRCIVSHTSDKATRVWDFEEHIRRST